MSSLSNDEAVKRQLVVTSLIINRLETSRVTEGMEAGDDSPHVSKKERPNLCCLMSEEWTQGLAEMGFDANRCMSQKLHYELHECGSNCQRNNSFSVHSGQRQ